MLPFSQAIVSHVAGNAANGVVVGIPMVAGGTAAQQEKFSGVSASVHPAPPALLAGYAGVIGRAR